MRSRIRASRETAIDRGNGQNARGYVMAEAVLTRKQVEEFTPNETFRSRGFLLAVLSRLSEYFFVHHGPGEARHRYRQQEKPRNL